MANAKSEIKIGVILSYSLIIINTIYGLIITPYILRYIGESSYGVYKSVSSISASLAIMDLGMGTTMTRYMARYNATGEKTKASTFMGMVCIEFCILATIIALIGIGTIVSLPSVYGTTFSSTEISLARDLLYILVLNMVLRMFENLLFGVLNGHERFKFANSLKLANIVLKFSIIIVMLPIVGNVKLVVLSETLLVTVTIIVFFVYIACVLHIVPLFNKWDNILFRESLGYTSLMFIQSITVQFNGNIDNVLIGAKIGATYVTVYSMSLTIFGMYENLSGSIANIMLPKVTKQVIGGSDSDQLQKTVEKAGRYQFLLLSAALGGFIVLGRDFYMLWLGNSFMDCYYLVLILIIPVTFPMMQNVTLSILRAENRMLYRTVTLLTSCICNVVITIIGIKLWGYWGAAVGTAFATIMNFVMMNAYYHKKLHFRIFRLFKNITRGILPCTVIASIITWFVHNELNGTWKNFIINIIVFILVYAITLFLFGLSKREKKMILGCFIRRT